MIPRSCFPFSQAFEAEHVRECLEKGLKESPVVPLEESLLAAEVMEDMRKQVVLGWKFLLILLFKKWICRVDSTCSIARKCSTKAWPSNLDALN